VSGARIPFSSAERVTFLDAVIAIGNKDASRVFPLYKANRTPRAKSVASLMAPDTSPVPSPKATPHAKTGKFPN
jgi:hypothetical protein